MAELVEVCVIVFMGRLVKLMRKKKEIANLWINKGVRKGNSGEGERERCKE